MKTKTVLRQSYLPPESEVRVLILSSVIATSDSNPTETNDWNSAEIVDTKWYEMYDL